MLKTTGICQTLLFLGVESLYLLCKLFLWFHWWSLNRGTTVSRADAAHIVGSVLNDQAIGHKKGSLNIMNISGLWRHVQLHWNVGPSASNTVKPVLRDHCHERPPVLKDQIFLAKRYYISMSLNLPPKTTCLQSPHLHGPWDGLPRQDGLPRLCWVFQDRWSLKTDFTVYRNGFQCQALTLARFSSSACPALTLSLLPPHAFSTDACRARP